MHSITSFLCTYRNPTPDQESLVCIERLGKLTIKTSPKGWLWQKNSVLSNELSTGVNFSRGETRGCVSAHNRRNHVIVIKHPRNESVFGKVVSAEAEHDVSTATVISEHRENIKVAAAGAFASKKVSFGKHKCENCVKSPKEGCEELANPLDIRFVKGDFIVVDFSTSDGNCDVRSISQFASTIMQASD